MRIVCGTDFSIPAGNAAKVAAALARRSNSVLRLWHAVEPSGLEFVPKESVDLYRKKLRRKLVTEGNRLREMGADVVEGLALGRPHEVLAHAAPPAKADLIVVSSIGQFAPSRWLVGSVAEKTAQLAQVPTLVVRDHETLLDWANGKRTLKVFVGYDFSASADAALHWVASLQRIGVCHTVVTYVSWPPKETWRFGTGSRSKQIENDPEIRTLLERDLKERCAQAFGTEMPELRIVSSWGSVDERLLELATTEKADVIVLGTNQRHGLSRFWLGSVSRRILNHTSMNVVCVPAVAEPNWVQKPIPMYRQVLAPTDFSLPGNRAIAFAYGAVPRGGEVRLVHVIPPVGGFKRQTETANALDAKRKQELAARLEALTPADAASRGIRSKVEIVEHEHPAAAICQAAERSGADLICIGSHGRSGFKKKLLGSVTESLLQRSNRPVLVIRE
jgi:nucleotide-binding universal stress UspA family protein